MPLKLFGQTVLSLTPALTSYLDQFGKYARLLNTGITYQIRERPGSYATYVFLIPEVLPTSHASLSGTNRSHSLLSLTLPDQYGDTQGPYLCVYSQARINKYTGRARKFGRSIRDSLNVDQLPTSALPHNVYNQSFTDGFNYLDPDPDANKIYAWMPNEHVYHILTTGIAPETEAALPLIELLDSRTKPVDLFIQGLSLSNAGGTEDSYQLADQVAYMGSYFVKLVGGNKAFSGGQTRAYFLPQGIQGIPAGRGIYVGDEPVYDLARSYEQIKTYNKLPASLSTDSAQLWLQQHPIKFPPGVDDNKANKPLITATPFASYDLINGDHWYLYSYLRKIIAELTLGSGPFNLVIEKSGNSGGYDWESTDTYVCEIVDLRETTFDKSGYYTPQGWLAPRFFWDIEFETNRTYDYHSDDPGIPDLTDYSTAKYQIIYAMLGSGIAKLVHGIETSGYNVSTPVANSKLVIPDEKVLLSDLTGATYLSGLLEASGPPPGVPYTPGVFVPAISVGEESLFAGPPDRIGVYPETLTDEGYLELYSLFIYTAGPDAIAIPPVVTFDDAKIAHTINYKFHLETPNDYFGP